MPLRDVIIIGAGPAGTATAARLHQLGVRDILVLERDQFPRDKPCGGGLTGHVDAALDALGLKLSVPFQAASAARIRFGSFDRVVALPRPVRMIRRAEFDRSLADQIQALGVCVAFGQRAARISVGSDCVTIRTATGAELAARVVVGADGAGSVVRKHLRRKSRQAPHRLFMQVVETSRPAEPGVAEMLFDFTPMLAGVRGYVWAFPLTDGCVNVGVMHYPSLLRDGAQLLGVLRAAAARYGVDMPRRGARGWPAWGYDPDATVAGPRLLAVGDAAGIDSLTGEGIAVAMEQAQLGGDAIARALAAGDFAFRGYAKAVRDAVVGRELMLDGWFAGKLYQAGPGWQRWMRLLLFDREFPEHFAARIAGIEILADRKRRLMLQAIARNLTGRAERRRRLALAGAGFADPREEFTDFPGKPVAGTMGPPAGRRSAAGT